MRATRHHTHTRIRTHAHAHAHTICMHTYMHTHTCTYTHACTPPSPQHTHTLSLTLTHSHTWSSDALADLEGLVSPDRRKEIEARHQHQSRCPFDDTVRLQVDRMFPLSCHTLRFYSLSPASVLFCARDASIFLSPVFSLPALPFHSRACIGNCRHSHMHRNTCTHTPTDTNINTLTPLHIPSPRSAHQHSTPASAAHALPERHCPAHQAPTRSPAGGELSALVPTAKGAIPALLCLPCSSTPCCLHLLSLSHRLPCYLLHRVFYLSLHTSLALPEEASIVVKRTLPSPPTHLP